MRESARYLCHAACPCDDRPLRRPARAGARRHGHRLPGGRPADRTRGRDQSPPARRGRRVLGSPDRRSAGLGAAHPPEHRRRLRHRRGAGPALRGDAVRSWPHRRVDPHGSRPAGHRHETALDGTVVRRPRLRPRAPGDSPRHQADQPADRRSAEPARPRLRHRQGPHDQPDPVHQRGHARLHGAGAGTRATRSIRAPTSSQPAWSSSS